VGTQAGTLCMHHIICYTHCHFKVPIIKITYNSNHKQLSGVDDHDKSCTPTYPKCGQQKNYRNGKCQYAK